MGRLPRQSVRANGAKLQALGLGRVTVVTMSTLLLFDSLLTAFIVYKVPYTKIDWDAYMSQEESETIATFEETPVRWCTLLDFSTSTLLSSMSLVVLCQMLRAKANFISIDLASSLGVKREVMGSQMDKGDDDVAHDTSFASSHVPVMTEPEYDDEGNVLIDGDLLSSGASSSSSSDEKF
ncbi:hypothetical protein L7F22_033004 [Adiantum nelumboides]|nr:hypothetical protein [Adiantum nelumboides]